MSLRDDQLAHYREHGWVAPIDIMSVDEATELRVTLEAAEAAYPDHLHAENRNNAHHVFPFLAEIALDQRIVDVAEIIVGPNIALWSTVLFAKAPQSGSFVSWHQDARYMGVTGENHVTAWLALTSSTIENGCVSVLPGSHRNGAVEHEDTYGQDNILTRGQRVVGFDDVEPVHLELQAGQLSLHHPWLVHGSQPNRTNDRRIGVALQTYMGNGLTLERGAHHVTHIRGDAVHEDFVDVPVPTEPCTESGLAHREAANQAFRDILYDGAEVRRNL